MAGVTVYGIENCDHVRRARHWLRARGIEFRFHDFRRDGLAQDCLQRWLSHVPWDSLLNRRGQTWRRLDAERRRAIVDQASAVEAMLAEPTLIRRPVVEVDERLLIGFSEAAFESAFPPPP